MTSLKGNRERQRKRNLVAKALNEKRTKEYTQRVIPPKKRNPKRLTKKQLIETLEQDIEQGLEPIV